MTTQDIMIGDWVKPFGSKEGVYAKVTSIEPNRIGLITTGGNPHHGTEKTIEPILINKEILEKNGFVKDDNDDCWGDANCFFIPNYVDKKIISWETHIEPDSGIGDFSGKLRYVHELQHALKVCGIYLELKVN